MPNLDDDRLESYMKQFRPLPAAPLVLSAPAVTARKPRHLGITVWTLAVAAVLTVSVSLLRIPAHRVSSAGDSTSARRPYSTHALTLRTANELLVNSSSFNAALESDAGAAAPIPEGKLSALKVLSQENLKP